MSVVTDQIRSSQLRLLTFVYDGDVIWVPYSRSYAYRRVDGDGMPVERLRMTSMATLERNRWIERRENHIVVLTSTGIDRLRQLQET